MPDIDIVATWPKTRSLESYLEELEKASALGLDINFRVPSWPRWTFESLRVRPAYCYMVHDGAIRGYNIIKYATFYEDREVARVENDSFAGFWPKGKYIVRNPKWHPVEPIAMKGFQGWRWFNYEDALLRLS